MKRLGIACAIVALSSPLAAQRAMMERTPGVPADAAAQLYEKMAGEIRARVAVEAQVTSGAPYSAEAVTESTQVLADGNRISRKSLTRVYRDNDGRTRREEIDDTGNVIGVSIVDPVAHASYVLNPASRTAYRDSIRMVVSTSRGRGGVMMRRSPEAANGEIPPPPPPPPLPDDKAMIERKVMGRRAATPPTREDLGKQVIEGVGATGSRTTTTIPAGAIGNLQPIKIVSEQWMSPDLNVLVMTKHSDPRSGETIYRLQNIVRAEPDRSLFTVPGDYTMKESGIREPLR